MQHVPPNAGPSGHSRSSRAFTIVELLVVIAVIIILLSILAVGLNLARKAAQSANTQAVMTAINQGVTRFRDDIGYLPPVLDFERRLMEVPDPDDPGYKNQVREWMSITSIPEYLIGYASYRYDGYGVDEETGLHPDEQPATGIRDPGSDGVWGAGTLSGAFTDRNPQETGQVFGPYLELKDPDLLGVLVPDSTEDDIEIRRPGDRQYEELLADGQPLVILDYWGEPIRYYRRPYPEGALRQSYRNVDRDGDPTTVEIMPTLSDFVRLRPFTFTGNDVDANFPDLAGDRSTSFQLQTGEYALYSKGPDRAHSEGLFRNDSPRRGAGLDLDGPFNEDNIVEVGP